MSGRGEVRDVLNAIHFEGEEMIVEIFKKIFLGIIFSGMQH